MNTRSQLICCLALFSVAVPAQTNTPNSVVSPTQQAKFASGYGRLPMQFEPNMGQTDKRVRFTAKSNGGTLFLTDTEAVLTLPQYSSAKTSAITRFDPKHIHDINKPIPIKYSVLRMKLTGARTPVQSTGMEKLPGTVNYFRGNDPKKWHTNIPTYRKAMFTDIYKGVDMVYYGAQDGKLEYDFVVKPGADPKQIKLAFSGASSSIVTAEGDLALKTEAGVVCWHKPVTYQSINGKRQPVACAYKLEREGGVSAVQFTVALYDSNRPLIIDPVLQYSTYLSGSGLQGGAGIAVDSSGNAYITGQTVSLNFPTTTGAYRTIHGAGTDYDSFVTKLSANGSSLIYSTYLGGSANDQSHHIAVDSAGNAYVTGRTASSDFPTTTGAIQTKYGIQNECNPFVTKLSANGSSLVYSTYLQGTFDYTGGYSVGNGIALDNAGNAYVTGYTATFGFTGAFVMKMNAFGTLLYSSRLAGADECNGIAVDSAGNAYVTGRTSSSNFPTTKGAFQTSYGGNYDTFVTKLSANGSLIYSTYMGGSYSDEASGIAVDSAGNAYVTGQTSSSNFPTTKGAFQSIYGGYENVFVSKLSGDGSSLVYSTYLGAEYSWGIAVDNEGNAYVTGVALSTNFPTTSGAFQTTCGGNIDAFVTKLSENGSSLVYSTYLGGSDIENDFGVGSSGAGIALDSNGNVYVTGQTNSKNFPTTIGAFQSTYGDGQSNVFVTKFTFPLINDAIGLGPLTGKGGKILYAGARLITYNGTPIVGRKMDFSIDGLKIATVVTDINGAARLYYLLPQETPAGEHTLTASFAGDNTYKAVSRTVPLTVQLSNTTMSVYAQTGAPGQVKNLVCRLYNEVGRVAANRTVSYSLGGTSIGTAVTNSLGYGNLAYTVPDTLGAGAQTFKVTFAGDTVYSGSAGSAILTIIPANTSLYMVDTTINVGQSLRIPVRLIGSSGNYLSVKTISLTVNGVSAGTAVTQSNGNAGFTYLIPAGTGTGTFTMKSSFAGDSLYNASTISKTLTIK